jgi:hypothetical protein
LDFYIGYFPAESGKAAGAIKNIIEICFPKRFDARYYWRDGSEERELQT